MSLPAFLIIYFYKNILLTKYNINLKYNSYIIKMERKAPTGIKPIRA